MKNKMKMIDEELISGTKRGLSQIHETLRLTCEVLALPSALAEASKSTSETIARLSKCLINAEAYSDQISKDLDGLKEVPD